MRVNPGAADASIEFFEFFLSVGDLQRTIASNINIFGDRWLFQDLSRTMDLRMLETVVRAPHARECKTLSLNLNLETIATPAFATFLERAPKEQKIIIEVQAIDVLANIRNYFEVQDVMAGLGHALLIDGLNPATLQMLDVGRLQPDYAKIMWAPEFIDLLNPDSNKSAMAMIKEIGAEKIVLARCDSQSAMGWGLKSGIRVFQGHFLDSFGKPKQRPAAGKAATR
jgi:EAL domain-containing protein (putative c-di-GMP-specific phosphodiesterase class I)